MMNRRMFLKWSAGAVVLAAAGALTGCGGTNIDLNHPKEEVGGVVFLCDVVTNLSTGGSGTRVQYSPYFAIWNQNGEKVTIPRKDITGTFTDAEGEQENLTFLPGNLEIGAKQYVEYNGYSFRLETENSVTPSRENGTYELRIKYDGKTIVFYYDGQNMTSRVEA